jgi:Trk K+ transport system NAD-binding subunit
VRELIEDKKGLDSKAYDVILFGLGRYGSAIAEHLRKDKIRLLAVDFNPDEVRNWKAAGYDAMYGDACDQEFISTLPLKGVGWVVSAMPQHDIGLTHEDSRLVLIDALKREKFEGKIAVSTQQSHEKEALKAKGADLVFLPFYDAAGRAVELMRETSA